MSIVTEDYFDYVTPEHTVQVYSSSTFPNSYITHEEALFQVIDGTARILCLEGRIQIMTGGKFTHEEALEEVKVGRAKISDIMRIYKRSIGDKQKPN